MSYYLFPKGNVDLSTDISIYVESIETINHYLSPSLVSYLCELQQANLEKPDEFQELQRKVFTYQKGIFDKYPNYTNDFFEIIEIVQTMHINQYLDSISKNTPLSIFSLDAGEEEKKGFLTAIKTIREPHKKISADKNKIQAHLPYKDNYFFADPVYSVKHFRDIYFNYGSKMHVILVDATKCKTVQEIIIQLCMILCTQAKKGVLFWKVGDTYTEIMLDILFTLSSFYDKTYFIKPVIMDTSNSDKYIVCKGFLLDNAYTIYSYLHPLVSRMDMDYTEYMIQRILSKNIPHFFISKLEEINYMFGQSQLEQLHYLSVLMSHKYKNEKIQNISKMNIQKTQEFISRHHYFLQHI